MCIAVILVSSPQCSYMISYIYSHYSPFGLLAQLVECCTDIAEVMGSNPVRTLMSSGLITTTSSVVFIAARTAYIRLVIITMWDSRKEGRFFTTMHKYDLIYLQSLIGNHLSVQQ